MLQMQHRGSPIWDVASAAIDASAAKQSRCDANAAIGTWMLHIQQYHWSHVAKPAIVSMFRAVIASLFRFCFACFEP